jgi:signal transduction histidine kinase
MSAAALLGFLSPFRSSAPAAEPAAPARSDTHTDSSLALGEEEIGLDEAGTVLWAENGGLASKLGIELGKPLWSQVRGLPPLLQDLLVNGRLHRGQAAAVLPVSGRYGEGILLHIRSLGARGPHRAVAVSAPLESPGSDGSGGSALDLQDQLDMVSRVVSLASGDFTPKGAAAEILRVAAERMRMDTAAFYVLRDYPAAKLLAAFGKTRRRGVPYPPIDCGHPLLAPLLGGVPLIALSAPGAELPAALEDVCVRDAAELLLVLASTCDGAAGVLVLSSVMQRHLDSSALHMLRLIAQVLGLVAQRDLLSAESERSSAVMETAYAVSRTISRSLDLEHTFQVVATNAARLVRGTHCLLFELEAESGDLVVVASSQAGDVDLTGLRLRLDRPAAEEMRHSGHLQLSVAELVWGAPVPSEVRSALDVHTALFLPMLAHNQLIGSLALVSPKRNRPMSARDIALAEEVADQAAVAITNARLYRDLTLSRQHVEALMGRMVRLRENERRDLANIVHDDIIQTVVGSVYKLETVRDGLPPDMQAPLSDAIGILQGTISDARHVISDLRPPALEGLGLAASLQTLVDRADSQGPARVGLESNDLPDLESGTATALYRIVREALVNAQRHARAHRIWVRVEVVSVEGGRELRLTVRDDGQGWVKREPAVQGHFGVAMMEEQAALAGGTLSVKSAFGEGVAVHAAIPI